MRSLLFLILLALGVLADDKHDRKQQHNQQHSGSNQYHSDSNDQVSICTFISSKLYKYCNFCYTMNDQDYTFIRSISCTVYYQDTSQQLQFSSCQQNCCLQKSSNQNLKEQFNTCSSQEQSSTVETVYFYALLAVGGTFIFFFIFCVCFRRVCKRRIFTENQFNQNSYGFQNYNYQNNNHPNYNNQNINYQIQLQRTYSFLAPRQRPHPQQDQPMRRDDSIKNQKQVCCICLQDNVNTLTSCFHHFHLACLKQWFKKKNTCPLCNRVISSANCYCTKCKNSIQRMGIREVQRHNTRLNCNFCRN